MGCEVPFLSLATDRNRTLRLYHRPSLHHMGKDETFNLCVLLYFCMMVFGQRWDNNFFTSVLPIVLVCFNCISFSYCISAFDSQPYSTTHPANTKTNTVFASQPFQKRRSFYHKYLSHWPPQAGGILNNYTV